MQTPVSCNRFLKWAGYIKGGRGIESEISPRGYHLEGLAAPLGEDLGPQRADLDGSQGPC